MTTFKKKLKGLLSAWLVLAILAISVVPGVSTTTVYAAASCGPNATYTISGAQLIISGTGAINANAFIERNDIQNIIIREGITSIGSSAFAGCQSLNQVSLPASLTSVGNFAFSGCQNLSLFIFNGTLEPSGSSNAFSMCNNLSGVLVPADYETNDFLELPVKRSYKFSSHPQNATVQSGGTATFSVTVAGTGLTYKWQYLSAGGSGWIDCSTGCANANTATMTVTADYNTSYNTDGTKYRCVVTPSSSTAITSNSATLTVTPIPHTHQWSYSVKDTNENGDRETIIATCLGAGTCDAANKTLKINYPLHKEVNDGKAAAATLSATSVGGITSFPAIVYQKYTQYPELDSSTTTTPPEVGGTYKASVTVGGVTAYINYTIKKLNRPDLKMFTVTDITPNSFVINLHQDDWGKTDLVCQIPGVHSIEITPDAGGRATISVPDSYIGETNLTVVISQKETDYYNASNQVVYDHLDLLPPAHPAPAVGEGFTIDYANEKITVLSGYEAFADASGTTPVVSGAVITPGSKVYIRKAASGVIQASEPTENALTARPAAPGGLIKTNETIKGMGNGKITGLDLTMEYKVNGGAWISASSDSLTNLAAGTVVAVRYKASGSAFASESVTFTMGASDVTLSVSFDLNGGTGTAPVSQTGLSYNALVSTPDVSGIIKSGYKLLGWSASASATTADWNFGANKITENTTLYAVWQEKPTVVKANIDIQGTITAEGALLAGNYDGNAKSFTFTNDLGIDPASFDVKYTYAGISTYALDPDYVTPKNAGYYNVIITRPEDADFKAFRLTILNGLYIAPIVVDIAWDNLAHTYDGNAKSVAASVTNALPGETINLTLSGNTATNAGSYTATVTAVDNTNYTIDGASTLTKTWSIAPNPIAVTWSDYTGLVYNAAPQTISATVSNKADSDVVNLTISGNTATNVGSYTATVTAVDNTNYTIDGGTGLSQDWTIAPKTLDSSNIQPIGSRDYTNKPITPGVLIKDGDINLVAGVDYAITGYTNNIAPGNARVSVEYLGNYTGNGTALFKINRTTILGGITFIATFNSNGGTVVEDKKVQRLQRLEAPYDPEKEGYIFAGWYMDSDLREKYSFEESVTDHLNLYAKWIPEEKEETKIYNDVSENDWFYEAVKWAKDNNYMNGVSGSSFAPNQSVTRAMFVTILYRIEGMPETNVTHSFEDVAPGSYYAKAVAWGVANGIVKGYSDSEFIPDNIVTREQMAAFVYRYAQLKGTDLSAGENTNILSYDDFGNISEYAIPAVQYAVGNKIISGNTASTINPQNPATRAETATVFMRAMKVIK